MEFPDLGVYVAVRDNGKFPVAEWEDDWKKSWISSRLASYPGSSHFLHGEESGYEPTLGQFKSSHGVTFDRDGSILVADGWNHHIQKFTVEGTSLGLGDTSNPTSNNIPPHANPPRESS